MNTNPCLYDFQRTNAYDDNVDDGMVAAAATTAVVAVVVVASATTTTTKELSTNPYGLIGSLRI